MTIPDPTPPEAPVAVAAPSAPSAPPPAPPALSRSAQVALGVFLTVTLGLLVFRGYGAWLGTRPVESAARPALTDINRADRAELEQVPGIGPSLAREITDDRQKRGQFKSVEELRRVKGIGPATFDKVRGFVRVEPSAFPPQPDQGGLEPLVLERKPAVAPYPRAGGSGGKVQAGDAPINVNKASVEELQRLPGIGPVTAKNIVAARTDKPFRTVADLDRVKGIGPKTLDKIKPFVVVE